MIGGFVKVQKILFANPAVFGPFAEFFG